MTMFNLRNLTIDEVVEPSFAVDRAGSYVARHIQMVDIPKIDIQQDMIPDPTISATSISPNYKKILGLKNKTKLSFNTHLRGTGTAAADAVEAIGSAAGTQAQLLYNFFGTESLDTGSTAIVAGSDVDTIVTVLGTGFTANNAVLINGEASPILSIATHTLSLKKSLSDNPTTGNIVYASASYCPALTFPGTLQFRAFTGADDYWKLLGCQLSGLKFTNLGPGQLPKMEMEVMCTSWTKTAGGALVTPTFYNVGNYPPIPGYASYFHMQTYGVTTKNHLNINNFSIDFGIDAVPLMTVSDGVQGVQSYVRSKSEPTFEVTFNAWDATAVAAWYGETKVSLLYQIGATAGNTILIEIPEAYLEIPEEENVNNQLGLKIKGYAIGLIPVRVHFL